MIRRFAMGIASCVMLLVLGCAHIGADDLRVWLPRHPDTALRVLVWNVDRSFFRENEGFQRVLRAADADLLILDEMPAGVSAEEIVGGLPAGAAPWQALYGTGGGAHQRASIAVRAPLQRIPEFDQLPYPRDQFDEWLQPIPPKKLDRARNSLEAGVASVGGVVEIDGHRLLVIGLDLECCGDGADSPQEQRRQFESRAIRNAIDAVADKLDVDAIIVGGDFNAVQGLEPVSILQLGARADTTLKDVDIRHRGPEALDWTWDGRGTPFPSNQLDYVLHSSRLVALRSQVFDTEDLTPAQQESQQLPLELSKTLSPHRPVVVDFGWRTD